MRVLYHHRTMADGAEGIHIREIVRALRALGHEVRVVALAGDPTQPSVSKASRVRSLRRLIPSAAYEVAELAYNVIGYRRLMDAVQHFRPDVIYDRYNSYSTAALRAARSAGVPLLLEVNAPVAFERTEYEHLQLKFPALARRYERKIFHGADVIFAVSTPLARHLIDHVGISSSRILILPNGADPDVFTPASGDGVRHRYKLHGHPVIGFVGILRPWHGLDLLLTAFREVRTHAPSAHLLIVGDGPLLSQVDAQARQLGLADAVTLTGRLPHDAVAGHVAAMNVCVSPHATFYASPMKIVEYMAMGKAIVAPSMDNIRDLIDDERTGVLFEPGNVAALAGSIQRLIANPSLRERLGVSARDSVVERFNWRQNARRVIESANSLLRANTSRGAAGAVDGARPSHLAAIR